MNITNTKPVGSLEERV